MRTGIIWAGRVFLGIIVLCILLILLVHTPPVKRFVRNKLQNYLAAKTNTYVSIASLNYRLPNRVELDGVLIKDRAGDTLLSGNTIRIDVNMINLLRGQYIVSKIELKKLTVHLSRKANDSLFNYQFFINAFAGEPVKTSSKISPFHFTIQELLLSDNTFSYNDYTQKRKDKGLDIQHLQLRQLNAAVANITYAPGNSHARFLQLSVKEQSGFVLDSLQGEMRLTDSMILVKNVLLTTPASRISGNALIYPAGLATSYSGNTNSELHVSNSLIAKKDIAILYPFLIQQYKKQTQFISSVALVADITGNASRLHIKKLALSTDKKDLLLNASGMLLHPFSSSGIAYDIFIATANATKSFIASFIPGKPFQPVNLPPSVTVKGELSGTLQEAMMNTLVITSAYGTASFQGQIENFTNPEKLRYNLRLLAKDFETGKWVRQDSVSGKLNGTISMKGSGINYKTAVMASAVDLHSLRLQKHVYKGIRLNINGNRGSYDIKGSIQDSSLLLNMNMTVALNQQYPSVTGNAVIKNADLYALGLSKSPLRFQSILAIQGKDLSPKSLNAFIRLDSAILYKDHLSFRADSLLASGTIDSGNTLLSLHAPFADATLKGNFLYNELPGIIQNYILTYTHKETGTAARNAPLTLSMQADIKPDSIDALLLPGLFFDKNIHAGGSISTRQEDSTLNFYLTAPVIAYNSNRLSNVQIQLNGKNDSVQYAIHLDTAASALLHLYTTAITGSAGRNRFAASFVTNDNTKKEKYFLSVTGKDDNDNWLIQFRDKLILNYADWTVDPKNSIRYSPQGINISGFALSKGDAGISINSSSPDANAPVNISINRFALSNITALFNKDSLEIGGMLNVQAKMDGLDKNTPLFSGTVKIDSLSYQDKPLGNITINAKNDNNQTVQFTGNLTGKGNRVTLTGSYAQDKIAAAISLAPIAFATIEPFTQHNLIRSSGSLTGNIHISGRPAAPEWNGSIHFDSVFTQLATYGTVIKISGQDILLQYPVIRFNQFTIQDSLNHAIALNGTLQQQNGRFTTQLSVKTNAFTVLDNTSVSNYELYGKAIVDADIMISGAVATPDITGKLGLKSTSQITYVRQEIAATAKDREGVMQFVNMDTLRNMVVRPANTLQHHARPAMLKYALAITIDSTAKFNVIIDPLTRDELQVQGGGQLTAGVDEKGDMALSGTYHLSKGSYQLNAQFLKRKFILQRGSTLLLSGDPENAEADITAIYDIDASPYDLVANEISDISNNILYRQKVPFRVILKIKGTLSSPVLSFDVQLKDKAGGFNYDLTTTIDNKLLQLRTDPAAMNKQVFALLVMGRFIGEQSQDFFAGSNGDGLNTDAVVKQSVSRFLSDAVGQIANGLIKGVDLDVNLKTVDNYTLDSYSATSQRTDLNVALSKRFLNDRLNVTVGKNFTVDGEDPLAKAQDNTNNQFLPDITTTYKLSKDGRYMLKAYQKSDYEAVLDGYFVETGIAFTLSLDYDTLKELLRRKKK